MTQQLPDVPDPLPALADEHLAVVPAGTTLTRWHDLGGRHPRAHDEPRWFGPLPAKGRFDHHPPPPADHHPHDGMSYAALDPPDGGPPSGSTSPDILDVVCCEVVQDGHMLVVTPGTTLTVFRTSGPLRLLDLRGPWAQLTRAGTHLSAAPHRHVQPWARAIRAAYPQPLHGVLYVPATGGRACATALNESAVPLLSGPVDLSRRVADNEMIDIIDAVAHRLAFTIELV